jgi:hypothetical protein
MVKTPNVRHSKSRKDPVTIDLDASRVPSEAAGTPDPSAIPAAESAARSEPVESDLLTEASEAAVDKEPVVEGEGFTMRPEPTEQVNAEDMTVSNEALLSRRARQAAEASAAEPLANPPVPIEPDPTADPSGPTEFARSSASTTRPGGSSSEAPAPRAEPRRSGLSAIAAGVIGGVIALLGAGALQYGGMLPSPGSGGDPAAVDGLRSEIANLQTELAALKSGAGDAGVTQTVADLQARVEGLATDLGTLRTAVESGGAGENAGLAALDAKVAELQTQLAQLGQASGGAPVDLAPVNDRIAALETGIKAATEAVAAGGARLDTLEQTVASLAGKVDSAASQPKIALSIASSALKAAIDRGQPFAAELDTLAAISPNLPQLAALRTHAEAGVATRDDLIAEMDTAANAMIEASKPVDPDAGYFDQLLESAASLVTVRPVGAVPGEGVPETVARMEAAVKAGDLAKATAEYETLPDTAKAAGHDFAGKIKARLDVETLVDQAIAEAMKTV